MSIISVNYHNVQQLGIYKQMIMCIVDGLFLSQFINFSGGKDINLQHFHQ